ncbi:hypothetical protein AMK59_6948 [Oryctes borbonicus]|uniref:Ubiquitin-like domain-containing protein n=1 Tax=Oryctes borbonicus TaxID=1629725 RepID=A0A0T6AWT2_9SCAR|nr:hypothetical protein AMK59_6948 [Oryctes borbonicus]
MSSDSDSDICDFTSDASKVLTRGLDQFWENYKKKKLKDDFEIECKISSAPANNNGIEVSQSTPRKLNEDEISIQPNIPDIQSRISNRLNKLSEEIQVITGNKRKRKARQKKPRGNTRKTRATTRNSSKLKLETVLLSSDEEINPTTSRTTEVSSLQSNQELNPIVTVNVLWKSVNKHSFKIPKFHPLSCILKYYIDKYKVNPKLLFFTLDEKQISLEKDSFVSLRLDEKKVIEGGTLPESYLEDMPMITTATVNEDSLHFKVQYSSQKNNEILVSCKNDDTMEIIFWQVSNAIKEPIEKIKLYFDGNLLQPNSKVVDQDLEEGVK